VVAVAAGDGHSLALTVDGTVLTWGNDDHGSPNGPVYTPTEPKPVVVSGLGSGSGVVAVAAGGNQSLALRADESVVAWGPGQHTPVEVRGLGAGSAVVAVSTGAFQNLALRSDGSVVAWGAGSPGPLLYGATGIAGTPVPMTGLESGSGVVAVSAGYTHSLALRRDGSVVAWGSDDSGQLGDGGSIDQPTPVAVSGLGPGSGVVAVSAGYHHSMALRRDGSVVAWGDDSVGQLGDGGTPFAKRIPVAVQGLGPGAGVVAVAAGVGHSVALRLDGSVLSWGWDVYGQLGDGSTGTSQRVPVAVRGLGPGSGIKAVSAGGYHNLVAKSAPRAGDRYRALSPARVWDSRSGPGPFGSIGPGGRRNITIAGVGGVPATGVDAVVLNVTAVAPTAGTFVTAWPTGEAKPLASNLNIGPGDTRANLVVVKVGAGGQVSFYNNLGSVNLVADVAGYFGTAGASLTSLSPTRVWDSRAGPGPVGRIAGGGTRSITFAGVGGVPPTGATAVVLSLVAVNPSAGTFITAWPAGAAKPLVSNLNVPPGDTRGNLVIAKVGTGGQVSFYNNLGTVDLVADIAGWYGPQEPGPPPPLPPRIPDAPAGSATTYQVDARHDGHVSGTLRLPSPAVPKWSHAFNQENENPPTLGYALKVGNRVFVTGKRFPTLTPDGRPAFGVDLYGLDAATGTTLWGPISLGDADTRGGLITADREAVYAITDDGGLQSYDQATGRERWSTGLPGGSFTTPPTASGGLLYVGAQTNQGVLYAVDTRTGLVRWTAHDVDGTGSPASVDDGGVYVSYGCSRNHRYDADQGTVVWTANTLCSGYGGQPAVLTRDSVYVADAYDLAWKRLARASGATLATVNGETAPAFDGDVGFFLAFAQPSGVPTLSAVDQATGAVLWTATGDDRFATPPLVIDGKVIIGSWTGQVTALDERTGAQVWSGTSRLSGTTGLNVADGLLLVSSAAGLVAFGAS